MIIDLHVPPTTMELIRKVQAAFPNYSVMLAGGYLRDLYRSKSPKDIDIFLIPERKVPKDDRFVARTVALRKLHEVVGVGAFKVSDAGNYCPEIADRGIDYIMYFQPQDSLELNIMLCDRPMDAYDLAATFDYTVNQIVMTSAGTVVVTQEFIDDFEDKKLRLTYPTQGNPFVEERLLKFMRKFPDFTLIAKFGEDPFSFGD
ncbi:nucleotidyltransferase [Aeromonas phage 1233]|nr:nucleotidyltransferase [Aeromonas phage 1233]